MEDSSPAIPLESLLEHGGYLRALARKLTLDDERAEDLVQQVWLTVLERCAEERSLPSGNARAWLHVVLRNLAFRTRRRELERPHRELRAALPEIQELDEDVDLDARQLVVEVLRGLRQPYRRTLYLRYVRGLACTEIARREKVPISTVKTRVQRGIASMREELDRRSHGDWRVWCLPLLGIAELEEAGEIGLMHWRLRVSLSARLGVVGTLAAAAALLAGIVLWIAHAHGPTEDHGDLALAPAGPGEVAVNAMRVGGVPRPAAKRVPIRGSSSLGPELTGIVLHPDGEPLAGARVQLAPRTGTLVQQRVSAVSAGGVTGRLHRGLRVRWEAEAQTAYTDDEGRFTLSGQDLADRRLTVTAEGTASGEWILAPELALPRDLGELRLEPPVIVSGRVIDARGEPVAGARFWAPSVEMIGDQRCELFRSGFHQIATSEPDGSFWLAELAAGRWAFAVESDTGGLVRVEGELEGIGRERFGLIVTLAESATIRGRLVGLPSDIAPHVRITATATRRFGKMLEETIQRYDTSTRSIEPGPDGGFELRGLWRNTDYLIRAVEERAGVVGLACSPALTARSGADDVVISFARPSRLALRLTNARDGKPLEGARVAWLADARVGKPASMLHLTRTGSEGHCSLPATDGSRGRLFVEHESHAPLELESLEFLPDEALELELEPAAGLALQLFDRQDRPLPGRLIVVTRRGGHGPRRARTDAEGRIEMGALSAGVYEIVCAEEPAAPRRNQVATRLLLPMTPSSPERTVRLSAGSVEVVRMVHDAPPGPRVANTERAALGGRLVDAEGNPVPGAQVSVRLASDLAERSRGRWPWERDLLHRLADSPYVTDEQGHFKLEGLAHGEELLMVLHAPGFARRIVQLPELAPGELRLDLELSTLIGASLRLSVEGAAGRSLFARAWAMGPGRVLPLISVVEESGEALFVDLSAGTWRVELCELIEGLETDVPAELWADSTELEQGEERRLAVDLR